MGKAIGIDLGTTNTAVAVLADGRPRVLEDEKGYKVLPSCVSLKDDGRFVVGQAARSLTITAQDRTAFAIKRMMGRRFDSPEMREVRRRVSYTILEAPDGTCLVRLGGDTYSPVELSALVLQVARQIAEAALGEEVEEAVITVPAYFNHAQRAATLEAAQLAGLRCERLLNEPTAAALAYGYRRDIERTLVIYDLGGGTFDISVLHLSRGVYEILATSGDTFLGGEDFDYRLVDYLADDFQSRFAVDLRGDRTALQRLKDSAEAAKRELSFTDRTTVLIPRITPTENLEIAVSRLTLESLVQDLVDRTVDITRNAVRDAGLQIADIDDVILVGGQTRMPRVREAISGLFNREPSRSVHPEDVVAIGAAVHAHSLVDPDASRPLLLDVTPFDLGIDVAGGLFQSVIPRYSQIPMASSRIFATARDNQQMVRVIVRQGDSRFAEENEFLGEFCMTGLTPAPRMQTKVEVTFRLDSNGMLHCSAVEPSTGERRQITIRNYAEVAQSQGVVKTRLEGDVNGVDDLPPIVGNPAARAAEEVSGEPAGDEKGASRRRSGGLFGRFLGGRRGDKSGRKTRPEPVDTPSAGPVSVEPQDLDEVQESPPPPPVLPSPPPEEDVVALAPEALQPVYDDLPVLDESAILAEVGGESGQQVGAPVAHEDDEAGDTLLPVGMPQGEPDEDAFVLPDLEEDPWSDGSAFDDDDPWAEPSEPVRLEGRGGGAATPPEDDFGFSPGAADPAEEEPAPIPAAAEEIDEGAFADLGEFEELDESNLWAMPMDEEAGTPDKGQWDHTQASRPEPSRRSWQEEPEEDAAWQMPDPPADLDALEEDDGTFAFPAEEAPSEEPAEPDSGFGQDDIDAAIREAVAAIDNLAPDSTTPSEVPTAMPGSPDLRLRRERGEPVDDEDTDIFKVRHAAPAFGTPPQDPAARKKKPARLKLGYSQAAAMVAEYRENLRRGGCFVRTDKPLGVGRECRIEVRAPGLVEPLCINGVVTWSSADQATLPPGQAPGMGIEYRMDEVRRREIEAVLAQLGSRR